MTDPEHETTESLLEEPCLPAIASAPEESLLEDLGEEGQPGSSRGTPAQKTQQFERLQTPLEVAMLTFVQDLSVTGRRPATLAWHKTLILTDVVIGWTECLPLALVELRKIAPEHLMIPHQY